MGFFEKIKRQAHHIYKHDIVCEQYPMLTRINRKEWLANGALGLVYMLHHITKKNPNGIPTNEDLKVSPIFLERLILKYKKNGFDFISLDELSNIINSNKKRERPFISFTIDDGYSDNYTQALPIFERHQVPFAIFIATDFIDQKAILWWDILEDLVLQNDQIQFEGKPFSCHSFKNKWDTYRIIREEILKFDQTQLLYNLQESFSDYHIDWFKPIQEKGMSWSQIRALSTHPLCTIGGHTVSHPALNKLSDNEFCREICLGINKLKDIIDKEVRHFAYPYGSPNEIGEREFQLIKKFKFKTVFSAYGGCITENNKTNITHLPRVYLHE